MFGEKNYKKPDHSLQAGLVWEVDSRRRGGGGGVELISLGESWEMWRSVVNTLKVLQTL
jgi:hypothetical protein